MTDAAPVAAPSEATFEDRVDQRIERLAERLHDYRQRVDDDPHINPIRLLAHHLISRIRNNELDHVALEQLVKRLTRTAFAGRAARLRSYVGEMASEANEETIRDLVRGLATGEDGKPVSFDRFREEIERVHYGFVVTAHPTFSLAQALQRDMVTLAIGRDTSGRPLDKAGLETLLARVEHQKHRPEQNLDLSEEQRQSLVAIANMRAALARVYRIVADIAREIWPDRWQELTPRLVTLASWVGYDTDGRSDIRWSDTLEKRVAVQIDQLGYYRDRIAEIRALPAGEQGLDASLDLIDARMALAIKTLRDEHDVLVSQDPQDEESAERLAAMSRELVAGHASRLVDGGELVKLLDRAIAAAGDGPVQESLWVLRAEIRNHGLTAARTHVRINAVQLHNAIRKTISMHHPADDPSHRLSYQNAVARLIDEVRPRTVNFGSVSEEKATARRVFMLIAQMLKHYDANEPVRFLIAETETPLTLLTALYFAKLFGVDHKVDISPLFETKKALERGVEIFRGAMQFPAYRDYLRRRGCLCIQTGFSDAGRYLGQIAASYSIERIRIDLRDLLVEHDLSDIAVVIFDTHGESIGRGTHPGSFADRLRYYDTPWCRKRFAEAGIRLVQESSYQGGDGYTYFLREESALAVMTRVLEHCLAPVDEGPDPFYADNFYSAEFFATIRQFNAAVIDDPAYAAFLGAWGVNMLYPTGSRSLKRQHDLGAGPVAIEHPSQLRAIPHNSILQQLGVMANSIGGVGGAVDKDPEKFQLLYRESPRFRRLMSMVEHAFKFTDLDVVEAYSDLFDPGMWLRRAQLEKSESEQEELRKVSDVVEQMHLHDRLESIRRTFLRDYTDLARVFRDHRRMTRDAGDQPIAIDQATRDNLHMLHALRIAIIETLMLDAVSIPDFSDRHATTHDELISRLMRLEVEPALALLNEVFPRGEVHVSRDYGEPADYNGSDGQTYEMEHERLFQPIAARYDLIRRISSGIIHHIGAIG